jgi:PAS domain S-box-containing protein
MAPLLRSSGRYSIAVIATAAALAIKLSFSPVIMPGVFLTFFGAVVLATWVAGLGPGLLSAVLSAGASRYFFLPPSHSWAIHDPVTLLRLALFLAAAGLVSAVSAWLRSTQRKLEESQRRLRQLADRLESRVEERTRELVDANAALQVEVAKREQTAEALRESEQRFGNAFEHAPIGMALVALDGRPLQINEALCRMLGYPHEELLPKPVAEIMHPDDLARAGADRDRLLAGDVRSYQAERRYFHKSGRVVWTEMAVSLVRDGGRRPLHLISHLHDITDRKQAEESLRRVHEELENRVAQRTVELSQANQRLLQEVAQRERAEVALRESEHRFHAIFDQAAIGVSQLSVDGRWMLVNQRLCDIVGYSREELYERTFQDITHPDDVADSVSLVERLLRGELPTYTTEKRYVRKDGAIVWVNLTASLVRDAAGQPPYGIAVIEDITERKRREAELKQLNQHIRTILEDMADGFVAFDHRGRFTYLNPSAERMLRASPGELIGKEWWEQFPRTKESPFYRTYLKIASERIPLDVEAYYPPLKRWFRAHGYPTQDGASVLFEDITQRHAEELAHVSDILHALNAHFDVTEAFPEVAVGLRALTGCARSGVSLFDEQREWVTLIALDEPRSYVRNGVRLRVSDIPAAADLLAGRPHIVHDLATELDFPAVRVIYDAGYRSRVSLPLRGQSDVFGVINLSWREVGACSTARLPVLQQVADAVALAVEKSRLFAQVRAGREQMQALSRRLMEVQEVERRHLAAELHDEIGQTLTGVKLMLDTIERLPPEAAARRLGDAQRLVDDLVVQVRELSLDLRPAMLDDLGLLPALAWLTGRYAAQTGVRVNFEPRALDRRLPPAVETAAYRIVQEALTNVARHAGVDVASVRVGIDEGQLRVEVIDEGVGFDAAIALGAGLSSGLTGMRERALLLGGSLAVESAAGCGTRVVAALPLGSPTEESQNDLDRRRG